LNLTSLYRQLGPGPKRDEAVKRGLAYAKARTRPYPPLSKRYDQIAAAIAIDETAALNSASWGLPQIMGFNHRAAGFQSARAMVASMLDGEGQQLEAFTNLLSDWKLGDVLRNRDWRRFALKYNGPNALKHGYDKRLRAAFEKYSRVAARAVVKPGHKQEFCFFERVLAFLGGVDAARDGALASSASRPRPAMVQMCRSASKRAFAPSPAMSALGHEQTSERSRSQSD
jgi:hypothetical protein